MEKNRREKEIYLVQAKTYQRLLEATNHHGGHTPLIKQVRAKVRKAERDLTRMR